MAQDMLEAEACSAATAALLGSAYMLESRGAVQIDGKGEMHTFLPGSIGPAE
jgi:hypothetical protein